MLDSSGDFKLSTSKEKILLGLCLLFIIVILLHIGFLENKFIDGDDLTRIVQNPLIRNIGASGIVHDVKGFYLFHYPSFLLTYFWGIIFSIWELNHIGFHFISYFLHALCSGLLFLFLIRITRKAIPSFLGTLIFALHPLHCETVNWISRQDMMLAVLFGLLYLYLSLYSRVYARIFSMLSILIAIAITPISILFLPGRALLSNRSGQFTPWASYLVPVIVFLGIWGKSLTSFSYRSIFITAPQAMFYWIKDFFLPGEIHFMIPVLPTQFSIFGVIGYVLMLASLVLAIKGRHVIWGVVCLCLASIWLLHINATRFNGGYAYIPLFWGAISLGITFSRIVMKQRLVEWGILIIFICISGWFGYLSYRRNLTWRNTAFLLKDTLKVSPSDSEILAMLGHYRAAFLNRRETRKIFQRIPFETCKTLCLKAKAYHLLRETETSTVLFEKLFKNYPKTEENKYCLFDNAVLNTQMNRLKMAKKLYRKIIKLDPFFIYARHDLGTLLIKENKEVKGVALLEGVLRIAPAYRPTLENIAIFYMRKNAFRKASRFIRKALDSTSCHDTQRFYKEWLKALKEKRAFGFASLQWANLVPPS